MSERKAKPMIDISELKRLNGERTPGPWTVSKADSYYSEDSIVYPHLKAPYDVDECIRLPGGEDAAFIALAANSMTALIQEIDVSRELIKVLEDWCKDDPCDSYSEKLHEALAAWRSLGGPKP